MGLSRQDKDALVDLIVTILLVLAIVVAVCHYEHRARGPQGTLGVTRCELTGSQ